DQNLDRRRGGGAEMRKETDHAVELVERGAGTVRQLAQGGDRHEAVRVLDRSQGRDDRGTAAHSFGGVSVDLGDHTERGDSCQGPNGTGLVRKSVFDKRTA